MPGRAKQPIIDEIIKFGEKRKKKKTGSTKQDSSKHKK